MKIQKRNRNSNIFYTFIILLLFVACEKATKNEELPGQLIGYITLLDNGSIMSDESGVEIVVEGSDPQIEVSTTEHGQFIIDNLKTGTYNFVFDKNGYCQHKIIGHQYVAGDQPDTLNEIYLYSIPQIQIDSLEIINLNRPYWNEFRVTAKVTNQNEDPGFLCRYYLSNEPEISYINYISTDVFYSSSVSNDRISFILNFDTHEFPMESELYMIMYPASETYQFYTDLNTGNKIYTSINVNNPSQVATITIPYVETP